MLACASALDVNTSVESRHTCTSEVAESEKTDHKRIKQYEKREDIESWNKIILQTG